MFWLTGSQQFHLMKNVSESLAGRVAILNLLGFSLAEERGAAANALPFLPTQDSVAKRASSAETLLLPQIYHKIWRGSFPLIALEDGRTWETFYASYVQTYLQRDVRDFTRVGDEQLFLKFLQAAAARTGGLINYADMARDIGISEPTVKAWLSILEASGLVYMLMPYHSNQTKRLVKAPKLYFLDTGLCSYLTGWYNAEVLEKGAMNGAIFETFVISELIKTYWHNGRAAPFFFYRDRDSREIDLVIAENGTLYPIEIKKTATPGKEMVKHFEALNRLKLPVGQGAIICARETHSPIIRDVFSVPVGYI
jgi:predicted AAA+ superfamily ATPase